MQGILSIQSQVVFGHVGHGAAQFALQCLGHEVWALPTVLFSNHPGHGGFSGAPVPSATLSDLLGGLEARGLLRGCRAVLSGYLGTADHVATTADAVARARVAAPDVLYCLDPVMGDMPKGTYVQAGIPKGIEQRLLPLADIVTPNAFELSLLSGRSVNDPTTALAAARALDRPLTVVTSVPLPSHPDQIGTMAVMRSGAWLCVAERLAHVPPGTGDLLAALILGHHLKGHDGPAALARAATAVDGVLRFDRAATGDTSPNPLPELPLIGAQAALRQGSETALLPVHRL